MMRRERHRRVVLAHRLIARAGPQGAIALLRHFRQGPADPIDGNLPSKRRNKAIVPYGPDLDDDYVVEEATRGDHALIFFACP
jgi:hypothetical protein